MLITESPAQNLTLLIVRSNCLTVIPLSSVLSNVDTCLHLAVQAHTRLSHQQSDITASAFNATSIFRPGSGCKCFVRMVILQQTRYSLRWCFVSRRIGHHVQVDHLLPGLVYMYNNVTCSTIRSFFSNCMVVIDQFL